VGFSDIITALLMGLGGVAVPLIFWITVLVINAVKVKNNRRVSRLILAGSVLNIADNIMHIPMNSIVPMLVYQNYGMEALKTVNMVGGLVIDAIAAAGIICFIYAFWIKFNAGRTVRGENLIDTQYRGETGI
jgi:hypothetical protein